MYSFPSSDNKKRNLSLADTPILVTALTLAWALNSMAPLIAL
jgi:hypothetical protein